MKTCFDEAPLVYYDDLTELFHQELNNYGDQVFFAVVRGRVYRQMFPPRWGRKPSTTA